MSKCPSLGGPSWLRPTFRPDATKERMLSWCAHRADLWETRSPAMRQTVEEYERAKQAALETQDCADEVH